MPTIDHTKREGSLRRQFPITDFDYHSIALGEYGRCAKTSVPSIRNISHGYFKAEARHIFIEEFIFFTVLVLIVAVPLVSGFRAMMDLVRATGGF